MNSSSDRLDRIEAILAATAVQTQANSEAIGRLEVQTLANTTAIDRLTDRIDRLTERVDRMIPPIQSHQEALRLLAQQQNDWREQMRIIQTEIRDLWQYLNNQLRNRGNGNGGLGD
jgi:chromosome segregation ATPase